MEKIAEGNEMLFMMKDLFKEIIKWSRLRKKSSRVKNIEWTT